MFVWCPLHRALSRQLQNAKDSFRQKPGSETEKKHTIIMYFFSMEMIFFFTFVFMSKEIFILKACKAKRKISFSACFWRFLHFLKSPWKDAKTKMLRSETVWLTGILFCYYLSVLSLSLSLSLSHPRLITRIWTWTLIFKVYFKLKRIDFGI